MKNSIRIFLLVLFVVGGFSCNQAQEPAKRPSAASEKASSKTATAQFVGLKGEKLGPVKKTNEEWKAQLTAQEFYVLRQAGTERAFTGDLWDNKKKGVYTCAACELPLFHSDTKFESGTGWPSFYAPFKKENVAEKEDRSYGMVRVEVLCARCGGHLGHVFDDGPRPTGLRYCMNSVSMNFVPEADKKKEK